MIYKSVTNVFVFGKPYSWIIPVTDHTCRLLFLSTTLVFTFYGWRWQSQYIALLRKSVFDEDKWEIIRWSLLWLRNYAQIVQKDSIIFKSSLIWFIYFPEHQKKWRRIDFRRIDFRRIQTLSGLIFGSSGPHMWFSWFGWHIWLRSYNRWVESFLNIPKSRPKYLPSVSWKKIFWKENTKHCNPVLFYSSIGSNF